MTDQEAVIRKMLRLEFERKRCPSQHPEVYARCELRIGHEGPHTQSGIRLRRWA